MVKAVVENNVLSPSYLEKKLRNEVLKMGTNCNSSSKYWYIYFPTGGQIPGPGARGAGPRAHAIGLRSMRGLQRNAPMATQNCAMRTTRALRAHLARIAFKRIEVLAS